jgi:ribonuclease P protein component
MPSIPRLKKRADFLRVSRARQMASTSTLIVQRSKLPQKVVDQGITCRVGFTASRRVGNAVQRNRARRRLRTLVQKFYSELNTTYSDFVFIAKSEIVLASFEKITQDCRTALTRLGVLS